MSILKKNIKKCFLDDCENPALRFYKGNKYCNKHGKQLIRNGKILEYGKDRDIVCIYDKNGCFNCISHSKNKKGYSIISNKNTNSRIMSRYIYKQVYGDFDKKLFVLHKCDNPNCINPEHLFLGTNKDNVDDMIKKNRQPIGEAKTQHKLTEKEVKEILESKDKYKDLSLKYNISVSNISNIKHRVNWKYLNYKKINLGRNNRKLDIADVKKILRSKEKQKVLAKKFNVNPSTISNIKRKKFYKYMVI